MAQVLLVDDDEVALLIGRVICERAGHHVETAGSGERALQAVARGLRPEIVVTDLEMPEIDGADLTRRLHASESSRATPILIYSGAPIERLKSAVQAAGANAWLRKPADPRALTAMIGRLLAALEGRTDRMETTVSSPPGRRIS